MLRKTQRQVTLIGVSKTQEKQNKEGHGKINRKQLNLRDRCHSFCTDTFKFTSFCCHHFLETLRSNSCAYSRWSKLYPATLCKTGTKGGFAYLMFCNTLMYSPVFVCKVVRLSRSGGCGGDRRIDFLLSLLFSLLVSTGCC